MADKKEVVVKYVIAAELKDCEVRKVTDVDASFEKDGKRFGGHHILLDVDQGEDCNRIHLIDYNMENLQAYKRGDMGTFTVRVDIEEPTFGTQCKCKISVVGFTKSE